ncbi:spore maturation protein [Sporanaerobium hydrogeniformans]|uniref:Spore maturation protein n=1 Tax=Sporanaerobium hydrogeniformans TaxID=3072179 RepID=A0AC61DC24_9FIRM|nr:nucleoside recognition domain-containing protein [Sporanaerobium hydrogeniformans]PHV70206.1 spore maturation protein [Sporanaerobium hydrogeniformans]
MNFLVVLSNWLIPVIILGIVVYGLLKNVNVYEAFIEGAAEGLKVVLNILPTLIGLMMAVAMLRTSGALNGLSQLIKPLLAWSHFPSEVIPVALMRSFSSSAATGLVLDLFKTHGPDSFIGRLVSIMFGCTETIFYTMSVYFMTVKIKDSRYTLAGALIASLIGIIASYQLTLWIFGL